MKENEFITLVDGDNKTKKLKITSQAHHDDGWVYFTGEDENGNISHYRVQHNNVQEIID